MFAIVDKPQARRVTSFAIPLAALMLAISASAVQAQSSFHSSEDLFSSSTDSLIASTESGESSSLSALPAEPAPAGAAAGAGQYGRYGEHHQNRWSSHLTFEAGGGFNAPTGDSANDITWGGNFTVGGGYRFNPHVSALIEYQFIDSKLPGRLISDVGATGGNAHIWSFTIAPVIDLFPKRSNDIYITGGGGFYRKVTNFTDPEQSYYCYYYYCGIGVENVVVGHYSSNQGGWNIGAGYTHRLGGIYGDSKAKLFAEARYLDVLTPASAIAPNGLGVAAVSEGTKIVPVTFGIRF